MSRTVREGRPPSWEHVRIELRDGRLAYVASPSGQAETTFLSASVSDSSFRVENPEHDFPQFIEYTHGGDSIVVRVGVLAEGGRQFSLMYRRAACPAAPPAPPAPSAPLDGTQLILLGTGTPNATPDRSGPAVAVVVNGQVYLVDAGPGVVRRAVEAGLDVRRLDRVFITHLHSDHTVGLPDLLFTPWVLEREAPLEVYGPRGIAAMMTNIVAAYDADIRRRIDGLQPQNETGYRAVPHEIASGVVFEDANVRVTAFAVDHEDWTQAYGYRFDTAERSIVISGDARPSESVVTACDGCDILVHEVYSAAAFERRAPEWQRYHAHAHTSAVQLADIARRARPALLVLYHQLLWGQSPEGLINELRQAGYEGKVVYGQDLGTF